MIDVSNYREMLDQYNVLKEEVKKFSSELSTRKFAIALTKIDAIEPDVLNEKIEQFIKDIGLESKTQNKFSFDKDKNYSESGIINRKSGELVHEVTKDLKSENFEKDISFYKCS